MKPRILGFFNLLVHILWAGNYLPVPLGWLTFDHDTGSCVLTVTATAALGFPDPSQSQGSGFWYPKWVNQTLYYGSMAVGNSIRYVVDAYYGQAGNDCRILEDSLYYHIPPEFGLQEVDCLYDDHGPGNPNPQDLECFQYSVADAAPDCDDFVIIEFIYTNRGASTLDSLHSAIFCDFDIRSFSDNYGKTNQQLRTAYMQSSIGDEYPTVGIVYLGSKPQAQLPVANLSVIDRSQHTVWNDSVMFLYMDGTYHYPQSNRQYDWQVVVSVGPFKLAPEESQHVAFAIVGGVSNDHYLENCRHAIEQYDTMWPAVVEKPPSGPYREIWVGPNPTRGRLTFNFTLSRSAPVIITLFDLAGREVTDLFHRRVSMGEHSFTVALPERISSGIYFLVIEVDQRYVIKKVILKK